VSQADAPSRANPSPILSSFSRGHLVSRPVFSHLHRDIHQSPLQSSTSATRTQAKDSRKDLTTAVLEHSSESTVAKWELAKDLRYKELWNKRHPALANPKSRNEGKVHRIRLSAEPGKLHRQITYASTSSPRSLFQPTEIIGGRLSLPTVPLCV